MVRVQTYYLFAIFMGSVLFFHCASANVLIQRPSKGGQGSTYTSSGGDVVINGQRQRGGKGTVSHPKNHLQPTGELNPKDNVYQREDADPKDNVYQREDANPKDNVWQKGGAKPQDNVYQKEGAKPQDNVYQKEGAKPQDNVVQIGQAAKAKKCKGGKDKCSAIESIVESYLEAVEKNVETFQKVNKNIEELLKIVSNSKDLCDQDGETENDTPKTLATSKPLAPRKKIDERPTKAPTTPTTSTSTESSDTNSEEEKENPESAEPNITYKTFVGKEKEEAKLKCDESKGETIFIIDAYYGASDVSKCPPIQFGTVTRETGDRKGVIRSLCGSWTQARCSFPITSSSLGDSCRGVEKNLRISYSCSKPGILGIKGN